MTTIETDFETVFIPTAGIGSRLNLYTKTRNKSHLRFKDKPIISNIIDSFDSKKKFVIALGHEGKKLKEYLNITYSNRIKNFTFVNINDYKSSKASLGLTLENSKKKLKKPFIFWACDSLLNEKKIQLDFTNFIIGAKNQINPKNQYRTLKKNNNYLHYIKEKKKKTICSIYTGIAGIKDYKLFWELFDSLSFFEKKTGETFAINKLNEKKKFLYYEHNWIDTGSQKNFELLIKKHPSKYNILLKADEDIFFNNDLVIKYFEDKKKNKNRIFRSKLLQPFVPKILESGKNHYSYKKIKGNVYSKEANKENFHLLLKHLKFFFKKKIIYNRFTSTYKRNCLEFYKSKTFNRLNEFKKKNRNYHINKINNKKVECLDKLIRRIDWDRISYGIPCIFHGDLHFENIIFNGSNFKFLDWREDFNNSINSGDLYYDLAKLYHGMEIQHEIILKNNYYIKKTKNNISLFIRQTKNINEIKSIYENWCRKEGYDLKKIKILTALIYLNIATLHHTPYDKFLFYFGWEKLNKLLNQ